MGKSFDAQFSALNSEQNRRNSGSDDSSMKGDVGGSTAMRQVTPKQKQFPANKGDIPALKKLAGGRPDVAKGKNVV